MVNNLKKLIEKCKNKDKCHIFVDKCNVVNYENKKTSKTNFNIVQEAMSAYAQKIDTATYFKTSIKNSNDVDFFDDKMNIINIIRKGLPFDLFLKIKNITPFTEEDWADYLNISKKTLQRNSQIENYLFKPIHTEKIIELAEVTNFGLEVFDSQEQFYLWLNTPSFALGNLKPAELLRDSYGKELVMNELNSIDQGIFA